MSEPTPTPTMLAFAILSWETTVCKHNCLGSHAKSKHCAACLSEAIGTAVEAGQERGNLWTWTRGHDEGFIKGHQKALVQLAALVGTEAERECPASCSEGVIPGGKAQGGGRCETCHGAGRAPKTMEEIVGPLLVERARCQAGLHDSDAVRKAEEGAGEN